LLNVNLTKIQLYIDKIKLETNPPAKKIENTATTFRSSDPYSFEVGLYRKEKTKSDTIKRLTFASNRIITICK